MHVVNIAVTIFFTLICSRKYPMSIPLGALFEILRESHRREFQKPDSFQVNFKAKLVSQGGRKTINDKALHGRYRYL